MMRTRKLTLAGLIALGVLAANATPSGAAIGYANLCPSLSTAFCTVGTIEPNGGVAVDNSSGSSAGDVWVASGLSGEGSQKLVKFDAAGNQLVEVQESL